MRWNFILLGLCGLAVEVLADPTWPSEVDELEEIMFQLQSFGARKFADTVSPCSNEASGPGRLNAAEWLRTAFHDMSTANTFFGTGGLDASLQYELASGENTGPGHRTTLVFMAPYVSSRSSLSDLLAMGVYLSVRSCGGPAVPIRAGRKDATARGSLGVPQPQNSVLTFRQQFERMGFTTEDMIQVTACGHTIGGVHQAEFPELVLPGSTPDGVASLDSTAAAFDNKVVTEYLDGSTTNPLVVGPAVRLDKHADFKVFSADGNVTMKAMARAETFRQVCKTVLAKMVDVVPPDVTLTDPIEAYKVKPVDVKLTLANGGASLAFTGYIRVLTTGLATGSIQSVVVTYKNRAGTSSCGSGSCTIRTTVQGAGQGLDDTFAFYAIQATIPASSGISSFTVAVNYADGSREDYDNNGNEYPLQDKVIFQAPQSCVLGSSGALTVVAAVHNGDVDDGAQATIYYKMPQIRSPVPNVHEETIELVKGRCVGQYTFYSADYTIQGGLAYESTFDVASGSNSDSFRRAADVGGTCREFTNPAPCGVVQPPQSTTATTTSTPVDETTTVSSETPVATPSHKEILGEYNLVSCWAEGNGVRALSGAATADDAMTLEMCMDFCADYVYWGTEYGRECYCGNTLAKSSTEAPLGDCNMVCGGDASQYCGAGWRLELYSTTAAQPSATPIPDPVHRETVGGHSLVGCWTEGSGVRALGQGSTASADMTNEACGAYCAGHRYFGTEYGTECYCGGFVHASSGPAPLADCGMTCGGNASEFCGAANRLELYMDESLVGGAPEQPAAAGGFVFLGCRREGADGERVLSGATTASGSMTNDACAAFCAEFEFFGTQYSRECFCGNVLSESADEAPGSDCGMLCSGTSQEFCGGSSRLSVYRKKEDDVRPEEDN